MSLFWPKVVKGETEGLKPAETGFLSGWGVYAGREEGWGSCGAHRQAEMQALALPGPAHPQDSGPPTLRLGVSVDPDGTLTMVQWGEPSIHCFPERGRGQARWDVLPSAFQERPSGARDKSWTPVPFKKPL